VKDEEIDQILNKAAAAAPEPAPELLQHVAESIRPSLQPVHPLAPAWLLSNGLVLVCLAVSLAGALRAGLFGFARMDPFERALIFPALAILLWAAARTFVAEMIPGSLRRIAPPVLLLLTGAALVGLFAFLFHDPATGHFVPVGLVCPGIGLLHAVPAALLSWLVLRRGFATNPVSAGLIAGTLGGLAGVSLLELHCPNFETAHVLVWHTAVVPVAAGLGALTGVLIRMRRLRPEA